MEPRLNQWQLGLHHNLHEVFVGSSARLDTIRNSSSSLEPLQHRSHNYYKNKVSSGLKNQLQHLNP
jgi:hypothetical protein